jgi:hypothetical protein
MATATPCKRRCPTIQCACTVSAAAIALPMRSRRCGGRPRPRYNDTIGVGAASSTAESCSRKPSTGRRSSLTGDGGALKLAERGDELQAAVQLDGLPLTCVLLVSACTSRSLLAVD